MSIHRVKSGLIFDDKFDTLDSRWVVSPTSSGVHSVDDKTLTLNHNATDRSTNALFSIPQEEDELLFQVQADYTPTYLGDEGGIVIWKNALEKVEFLESEDSTQTGEYSVWRAVKRHNLWTFFAERGSDWELFDSTVCVDPLMAGVVVKGVLRSGYVPVKMKRAILCKGSSITVGNINSGYRVDLINEVDMKVVSSQIVPEGFSGIDVELPTIPFNGKLKIYTKNDVGNYVMMDEQEEYATMYGGDMFMRGTDLKVLWQGKTLSEVTPTHLGALKSDLWEQKMTVWNDTTGNVAENVVIRVAAYEEDFGWTWCDLARDVAGAPNTYDDTTINMGSLLEGQSKDFWVKITRQETLDDSELRKKLMRPTHFYLEVLND